MIRHRIVTLSVLLLAWFAIGCGGGGESGGGTSDTADAETSAAAMPAGSAAINGSIMFEGTAPERQPLELNRECMELRDEPPLSESVVVNENGTLQWVFVYVKEGLGDQEYPVPSEPVVMDQQGCMYTPHVFGVQAGQPIEIRNSDPFQHNIHALPKKNRPFNFSQPVKGMSRETTFKVPEVMVQIKCDVHGWMQAWAGVLTHPFYAVSGDEGAYSIENLPAGDYVIEAWHEEYGTQTQNVTVGDGASETLNFTFSASASG